MLNTMLMESEAQSNEKWTTRGLTRLDKLVGRTRSRLYRRYNRIKGLIVGTAHHNCIYAYWWDSIVNFGDLITARLLESYGFTPIHCSPKRAQVVATGSVLERIPEEYQGVIIGSGLIHGESVRFFSRAKILALRGELTRQRLGAPEEIILGDPGLLIARLSQDRQKKRFVLGLVPHYVDHRSSSIRQILKNNRKEVCLIDPRRDPIKVVRDIDTCEFILSSSLHGLVCADALGIPSAWILLSDRVIGSGFKFRDYYSALRMKKNPTVISGYESLSALIRQTSLPDESVVCEVKTNLDEAFRTLSAMV
nr:polysaccharide pyruvyl transferase family protein [Deltaproteobacteria bacterium]